MANILHIEDSPDSARAIGFILKASNHTVVNVPSTVAASAALERQYFDLIIADNGLQDPKSGAQFAKEIYDKGSKTPLIMVTNDSLPVIKLILARLGFTSSVPAEDGPIVGYLHKSQTPDRLNRLVESLIHSEGKEGKFAR